MQYLLRFHSQLNGCSSWCEKNRPFRWGIHSTFSGSIDIVLIQFEYLETRKFKFRLKCLIKSPIEYERSSSLYFHYEEFREVVNGSIRLSFWLVLVIIWHSIIISTSLVMVTDRNCWEKLKLHTQVDTSLSCSLCSIEFCWLRTWQWIQRVREKRDTESESKMANFTRNSSSNMINWVVKTNITRSHKSLNRLFSLGSLVVVSMWNVSFPYYYVFTNDVFTSRTFFCL